MGDTNAETADRLAILELLNRYANALSDKDWDAWEACFTPDAHCDYTSAGSVAGTPAEARASLSAMTSVFDYAHYQATNAVITFTGPDQASVVSRFRGTMRIPGETPTYIDAAGVYDDVVSRSAGGWKFTTRIERFGFAR